MTHQMPHINLEAIADQLDTADFALVKGIVNSRTGELRASKPELPRKIKVTDRASTFGYTYDYSDEAGRNAG